MKKEFHIFLTSVMFFTRIPLPFFKTYDESYMNQCSRYFPLIGILLGSISFLFYWVGALLFGTEIAIILSLVAGILTTGAFHEDGFADAFDGFGGGWDKAKILDIMKDSRLGTYGTVAIILLLGVKYLALLKIIEYFNQDVKIIFLIFISYHALARTTGIFLSFLLPYSRDDESSKSKPLAKSFSWKEVVGSLVFGLIPFGILLSVSPLFGIIILPLIILLMYSKYYFNKWIDGYTGDCLGAVEQFAEVFILLSIIAICQFI